MEKWNLQIGIGFGSERECDERFVSGGPYYHLTTDGTTQETIFLTDEDFKFGMNAMAACLLGHQVEVLAFVFMNNHLHWILEGGEDECRNLYVAFRRRLVNYLQSAGRVLNLSGFDSVTLVPIDSLAQLRNEIAYVHRNPFVVRKDILPHTYRWGDGCLYFNEIAKKVGLSLKSVPFREKRTMFRSRIDSLSETDYYVDDGYVLPFSFSSYQRGMSFYQHASQYYAHLNKNQESFGAIAQRLGDSTSLNDEEIFTVARTVARNLFSINRLKELNMNQRFEVARTLRFTYGSSVEQICRTLSLDRELLGELLPQQK